MMGYKKFSRNNWYAVLFAIGAVFFFLGVSNLQRDRNVFLAFFGVGILFVIVGTIFARINNTKRGVDS